MTAQLILSVDAMGGDDAPGVIIEGVSKLSEERSDIRFLIHGDQALLDPLIDAANLTGVSDVRHSDIKIDSEMKPSQALRKGKGSSMWNAIEAVKTGEASASISAGNTGALMAISMLVLRKMDGVHRPAMTALWPTQTGRSVVLDVGANIDADASQLVSFAIMGEAYARATLGKARPTVGLLNIGSEDTKGHDTVREAHQLLKAGTIDLDYQGFVEGDGISAGDVDVVVTDGYSGNIALKTGEGIARLVGEYVKEALTQSGPMTKFGALLASNGLKSLKERMDPSNVNGGVLLGLNGVSVKSHGGADAKGFARALNLAADLASSAYREEVATNLAKIGNVSAAKTAAE